MYKPQKHNSIQCACFVTVILQWMRRYRVSHAPLLSPHASSPLINTLTNVAHSYDESVNCMEINITHSSLLKESSPWVWTNIQECIHHDAIVQLFSFKILYALAIDRFFFSLCPWCRIVFFREICPLQTSHIIASLHLLFTWGDSESWRWEWFLLTGLDGYRGWS